jgi:hypothetical protein
MKLLTTPPTLAAATPHVLPCDLQAQIGHEPVLYVLYALPLWSAWFCRVWLQ